MTLPVTQLTSLVDLENVTPILPFDRDTNRPYSSVLSDHTERLLRILQKLTGKVFAIVQGMGETNLIGIIINTSIIRIKEQQDSGRDRTMNLPYFLLKGSSQRQIAVIEIHVPGCNSQYPQSRLEALAKTLNDLGEGPILAMGDLNTVPKNTRESLIKNQTTNATLLVPAFPTLVDFPYPEAKYVEYYEKRVARTSTMINEPRLIELIQSIAKNGTQYLPG